MERILSMQIALWKVEWRPSNDPMFPTGFGKAKWAYCSTNIILMSAKLRGSCLDRICVLLPQ